MNKRVTKLEVKESTLVAISDGGRGRAYPKGQALFLQGDAADSVFRIERGRVKLTVVSQQGKAAVVAMLDPGDFFGEGCLAGQPLRMSTAYALTEVSALKISKKAMVEALQKDATLAEVFMAYVLSRNVRIEEDLVDQLFNSSEKRLARILLLLAHFGKEGQALPVLPRISQQTLAEMVGTTRPRISVFMNKFRKLGLLDYNGGLKVHSSLLNVVLHD